MPSLPLPFELYELFLDELAVRRDYTTLRSCALVCRVFRTISQTHLFAQVTVVMDNVTREARNFALLYPSERDKRLLNVITNPGIAKYVRSLCLRRAHSVSQRDILERLPAFLSAFTSVRELTLSLTPTTAFRLADFHDGLRDLGNSPTLQTLNLESIHELTPAFLALFPHVSCLSLVRCTFASDAAGPVAGYIRPRLAELDCFRMTTATLDELSLAYDLGHIRKLSIAESEAAYIDDLCALLAGSPIEELAVDVDLRSISVLDLTVLSSLRLEDVRQIDCLRTLPSPGHLKHLTLVFWHFLKCRVRDCRHPASDNALLTVVHNLEELAALDRLLPQLTGLRTITLVCWDAQHFSPALLHDALGVLLPNAAGRQIRVTVTRESRETAQGREFSRAVMALARVLGPLVLAF